MKVKRLNKNSTLLSADDESELFFSYDTCVAGRDKYGFFKTSTGYYKGKGASVEDVQIIKSAINESIFIKASGGIKNREDCIKMINAGAQRIGTSSALRIFKNE